MKPNEESGNDRKLDAVLKEWVVDAPIGPRFQEEVWKRIARADPGTATGLWASLKGLLESALPQPKVAYSYLLALLLIGMAAGSVVAQKRNHRLDASLGSRYLQTIDPYQTAPPGP